jgi:tRNA uridine 5-carboxymethylaminomethyl modification enzyme
MFTSRAEFRLHLRIDNADRRLTPHGRRVGLISDESWADFQAKQERLSQMKKLMEATRLTPEMLESIEKQVANIGVGTDAFVRPAERSEAGLSSAVGQTLAQLLKRPEVTVEQLVPALKKLTPEFFERNSSASSAVFISYEVRNELKSVETEIKYEGYLLQQQRAMERLKKSEQHSIPEWFDYKSVSGLSREMQEAHEGPPAHHWTGVAHSWRDSSRGLAGKLHRNPGRCREQAAALYAGCPVPTVLQMLGQL